MADSIFNQNFWLCFALKFFNQIQKFKKLQKVAKMRNAKKWHFLANGQKSGPPIFFTRPLPGPLIYLVLRSFEFYVELNI